MLSVIWKLIAPNEKLVRIRREAIFLSVHHVHCNAVHASHAASLLGALLSK